MQKDFDGWNKRKKQIHYQEFAKYFHEREVWWAALGVNIGYEQDGKHFLFERPVLIIKKFNKDIVLVAPITSKIKHNKYYYSYTRGSDTYAVIISQIRLLSTKRLLRRMYHMDYTNFMSVLREIKGMLG